MPRRLKLPDSTREHLAEMSKPEANWDSYGASPPSPGALAIVESVIARMAARFDVTGLLTDLMPIADGGAALD